MHHNLLSQFLENLEEHQSAVDVIPSLPERAKQKLKDICSDICKELKEELARDVSWSTESIAFAPFMGGFFELRFKFKYETFNMMLPWEFVHELSTLIRNENAQSVLLEPGEDEATSAAYLAAKVLSRIRNTLGTKAYLCAAEVIKEPAKIESKLAESNFSGLIDLQGERYPIRLSISNALVAAAAEIAKKSTLTSRQRSVLEKARTRLWAKMAISAASLDSLIDIRPGNTIVLGSPRFSFPEITLNTKDGNELEINRADFGRPGKVMLQI
ncbi:MAG: hypothetical protein KDD66_03845 [Bdellovibrionales bacterium]|nr:hypothetical protein [Bdellovibrionales bacterium]